jgi:hypothetical protein
MDISNTHLLPERLRTFFKVKGSHKIHRDVDVGYNYFVEHKLGVKHACGTIRELLVIHTTKELERWEDV